MRLNVYSVYDTASACYDRPFCFQSDGQALRAFLDICRDKEHPIGKHPEDFSLFRIGTYDDNKGSLNPEHPECLATALEMVAKEVEKYPTAVEMREVN